jgi:hypothetical protein
MPVGPTGLKTANGADQRNQHRNPVLVSVGRAKLPHDAGASRQEGLDMGESSTFDRATARVFSRRPGGSRHLAYQDGAGSICLWVQSELQGGGCAVSASAVEWLAGMPGAHFIRLTNERGRLDAILPVGEVPLGEARDGLHGRYFIVDPDDLNPPDFPPIRDFADQVPF